MSRSASHVVVTGIGVVNGVLCGVDQLGQALAAAAMPCVEVDRSAGYHLPESSRLAVLAAGLDVSRWVPPAAARRMSAPSKFAVAAARMAVDDAGHLETAGPRTAVVMSNALGASDCTERLLKTAILEGPAAVSPFVFTESVANAAAAQVAIACQARGANLTIVQREAGILTAVGRGAAEVASGRADIALVGGVDEMPPVVHAILDRLDALARPGSDHGEAARPFDRRRSGFVAGEGAVVLVLEDEERARTRGARVRARIRGFASAFDPSAPRIGWGQGEVTLASALCGLLDRAGVTRMEIGRIVSGASGSVTGDRLEAATLTRAWDGEALPPVLAPKGVTGHYGGGFLAAAILAVSARQFGATAGFGEPDPRLRVVPHLGGPLDAAAFTLVTSLASGGAASWLLLEQA